MKDLLKFISLLGTLIQAQSNRDDYDNYYGAFDSLLTRNETKNTNRLKSGYSYYNKINHSPSRKCRKLIQEQSNPNYWINKHTKEIETERNNFKNYLQNFANKKAKNIILFIGDGMNIDTISASRMMKPVPISENMHCGEEIQLVMEQLQFSGFAKTYSVDRQTADSASTATAFLTGIKGNFLTINADGDTDFSLRCSVSKTFCGFDPESDATCLKNHSIIRKLKQKRGFDQFKVGIVTTTYHTHATPAPLYSCWPSRLNYDELTEQFKGKLRHLFHTEGEERHGKER